MLYVTSVISCIYIYILVYVKVKKNNVDVNDYFCRFTNDVVISLIISLETFYVFKGTPDIA